MGATLITTEELMEFKMELLDEIKQLFQSQNGSPSKKWLKSHEVMKLLGVSPGTLQNMRINGTLPYTKVGGILYYDYQEIMSVLEQNRVHNKLQ
ncbi:helix-turn-helix domain-containing protein [Joostella sp.]|uniref:helix-turn-helix domain-containing protein n=1 Tax=Joostella sp. TaxID=2231138 RepID=UPI003A8EC09E